MSLVEKIRKAREQIKEVGGFKFRIRRPTDVEVMELSGTGTTARFFPFIIGWDGPREIDIIPGGDPHPLEFDEAVRDEWLSDRPDLFGPLIEAIMESYKAHAVKISDAQKNSSPGSSQANAQSGQEKGKRQTSGSP